MELSSPSSPGDRYDKKLRLENLKRKKRQAMDKIRNAKLKNLPEWNEYFNNEEKKKKYIK